ncbi:sulfotransferase domain-containing protein [Desulfosarcina ovata]|nr:sulfotransferase domain-containing protein [Desulfosarcina ovata]
MIYQKNNVYWHKFNALSRYFLSYTFSGIMPYYIVNEYPKSGGSWIGQMLAAALDVPFPRNRLPMLRPCIMHGHFLWPSTLKNVVIVWRDGRDVIVSQYFHSLFQNEKGNKILVEKISADLKYADVKDTRSNLPSFIEYIFKGKKYPKFSWLDFAKKWQGNSGAVHVKYEDFRHNCSTQLQQLVGALKNRPLSKARAEKIEKIFSFESQSGRAPGQENSNSFMRKGIVGDWKSHFTNESKEMFDHYAGDALISLGYEKDKSWVNG